MATLSQSLSLHSVRFSSSLATTPSTSLAFHFQPRSSRLKLVGVKALIRKNRRLTIVKAVEEETQVTQEQEQVATEGQPVVVPVSSSDKLTMYFQMEH